MLSNYGTTASISINYIEYKPTKPLREEEITNGSPNQTNPYDYIKKKKEILLSEFT